MIEHLRDRGRLLAILIPASFREPGIHFCTDDDLSLQMALMSHPAGKTIDSHLHPPVDRTISETRETLFVRKGKLRVDFYSLEKKYLFSRELVAGDVIMLIDCGHGFEVLEDVEMIEVKQGPFLGDADKVRFERKEKEPLEAMV